MGDNSEHTEATQAATTSSTAALPRKGYKLKEAAQILGISYISAYRLVQRGLLKSSKALRTKIIAAEEIDRFLKESAL